MYRQALLMAGDAVYRDARMRDARMHGDPLFPLILAKKLAPKILSKVGRLAGLGRKVATVAARHPISSSIIGSAAVDIAASRLGGSRAAAARAMRGMGGGGRRMRVTNPKALRRAIRRVTGFAKTVKRMKRAVSLAASAMGVKRSARKAPRRGR